MRGMLQRLVINDLKALELSSVQSSSHKSEQVVPLVKHWYLWIFI